MPNDRGAHLKELVEGLQTRSPQEVMGSAATSSLFGSVVTAAGGLVACLIAATVLVFVAIGPPQLRKKDSDKPVAAATASANVGTNDAANGLGSTAGVDGADANAGASSGNPATDGNKSTDAGADKGANAVDAMGIGETKDPDAAPESLDSRLDDLLQGLE